MEDKDGIWRTIRGRRIFIASGQSLGEAMAKSGKFKNLTRTKIRETKDQLRQEDRLNKSQKYWDKQQKATSKEKFNALRNKAERDYNKLRARDKDEVEYRGANQAPKNRINENAPIDKDAKTRVDRNIDRYSEADRQEIRREDLQRQRQDIQNFKAKKQSNVKIKEGNPIQDLADERIKEKQNTLNNDKAILEGMKRKGLKEVGGYTQKDYENRIKKNEEYLKQSNNKIETISQEEYDKMPKDYKGTLKELVETREKMGDKDIRSFYENKGFDVENDKTIMRLEKEGTTLRPVKIDKQSNNKVDNEYHFAGEELYSDDPRRYDDTIKSAQARKEKFKADANFKKENHLGWGDYNKDGVPVYDNDINYKGDFGWANLKSLTDDDLTKALNVQSEEYHKAMGESVGDLRTRNGRMNKIFKNAKVGKYEKGMNKLNEEMQKRNMPRYNIYDKKNPNNILVSSPTKEMADKQIQDMYKTDMALQKEYGWKELPRYDYRVGKVDENLKEIKETIKRYKQRKGK